MLRYETAYGLLDSSPVLIIPQGLALIRWTQKHPFPRRMNPNPFHSHLEEPVRLEMTAQLNQLLADTMTLRDLYKKSHWQVAGPTFHQLHLLFDKHFNEQVELVDAIAERIQLLGGLAIAMAPDVAETTQIERPPRGREEVPVQLSRLLDAHKIILRD